MSGTESGWTNLVLNQLETLASGVEGLRSELQVGMGALWAAMTYLTGG